MKNTYFLLLLLIMFLQGCGFFIHGIEESRARKYPRPTTQERQGYLEDNLYLSERIRSEIRKGRVTKGMSREDVLASWGSPAKIKERNELEYDEVWVFHVHWTRKMEVFFRNGIVVGGDPDPDDLI